MQYSSDFETIVNPKKTRVWAWSSCEIGNEKNIKYGNSISSFIEFCMKDKNPTHYFHNLKFDGVFIMDYLFRELNYTCLKPSEKPRPQTFSILMNKMNVIYSIKVYIKKKGKNWVSITFLDSLKKIPFSVAQIAKDFKLPINKLDLDYETYREENHKLTQHEIEYITNDVKIISLVMDSLFEDGDTKMTSGSDALAHIKRSIGGDKVYRKLFPILSLEVNEDIRKAYKGGYVYVNPHKASKTINKLLVYDKNSMYPSKMHTCPMPYGMPKFFEGKYEGNDILFIQHIACHFKVKRGYVPTIQLKGTSRFGNTEYIRDSKKGGNIEPVHLYLAHTDLELFLKHYDVEDLEYINGYSFSHVVGKFDNFILPVYDIKCHSKGAVKTKAKLKINSGYGKFATNPNVTGKYATFEFDKEQEDYIVHFRFEEDEDGNVIQQFRDPEYTPLGVFITAYARYDLINVIDQLGGEFEDSLFCYCDTDSVHYETWEEKPFIPIDQNKLDYWKKESQCLRAKFLRAKTYVEEEIITQEEYEKSLLNEDLKPFVYMHDGYYVRLNVKCAGMPQKVKQEVTFDNFQFGFISHEKLKPKIIPGGVYLEKIDFEIKEGKI